MKKIALALVVLLVIIQFFRIDKTNPPVNQGMDFLTIKNTPESTAQLIKASCYDCHSNETEFPWYSNVQPFAWFLQKHIEEGRKHLNFSTFATYEAKKQAHKLEECSEVLEKGEMPMQSYLLMHSEAKLTDAQKTELVNYFKKLEADTRTSNNLSEEPEETH